MNDHEAQYRALFELLPGSVVLLDAQGFVRDANPFFCQHMGYTRQDLLGLHVTKFSKEQPEVIAENIRRLLAGEILEHEIVNVQKDGQLRFYELREVAVTLPEPGRGIFLGLYFAIPHFELFDMRDLVIHNWPLVQWKFISLAVLYALAYTAVFLTGACLVFRRKAIN